MLNRIVRSVRYLVFSCALLLLPLAIFAVYIYKFLYLDTTTHDVSIIIEPGTSVKAISTALYDNQVIENKFLFNIIARLYMLDKKYIKAGEYLFLSNMKMADLLDMLLDGRVLERRLLIIEGNTVYDVITKVNALEDLKGDPIALDSYSEGVLLPNTYHYTYRATKQGLLDQIREKLLAELNMAWELRDQSIPLKEPQEVLILASIVEKEAMLLSEMPKIASVYLNRIKRGMRLQADPTVIYGLSNRTGKLGRKLTSTDLKTPNPYNTYLNFGLPPSPICNPSINAIKAVTNPERTNFLFFVANGRGGHWFSTTYRDHAANVANFRKLQPVVTDRIENLSR